MRVQRLDGDTGAPIEPALDVDGAGARHDVIHAVGEDRVRENGRRAGAVADGVTGPLRCLAKHLGAEIFLRVLEIEFLGDGDAVVADDRRTPVLLDQHALRLRPQRDAHRVGEQRRAAQDFFAGRGTKQDLFVCHWALLQSSVVVGHCSPATALAPPFRRDTAKPAACLLPGNRDGLLLLLRFRRLGHRDGQNTVLEVRFDLVDVDAAGYLQRAAEGSIAALGDVPILGLLFLLLLLFALDRQDIVGKLNVDVLGIEARKLGCNLERLLLLDDVDGRRDVETQIATPERLDIEERTVGRSLENLVWKS